MDNPRQGRSAEQTPESIEHLRQLNRQQAAAIRAKGRMIDNMAYQIRTLSNAIIGFSDLLLSENLPDDQRDFAQEIHLAGKGLSELVNEVLDWARLESGRLHITRTDCDLMAIVKKIDLTIHSAAVEKGLEFAIHCEAGLPTTIVTDGERLFKCLINLAANAIQYTEQGFVRISVRPQIRDGARYVCFEVADSGRGIASEKLTTIFEPTMDDEDVNAQVLTMLGGTLAMAAGLPLTHRLAELLGAEIDVHSKVGKGSTFMLRLPVDSGEAASAAKSGDDEQTREPAPEHEGYPILLVEDQESNRTVVRLMLQTMGYEVETAVDGQEAVEMATSRPYSLIFMDLKMPRMDGYEATHCLRNKLISVPIVALSAMEIDAQIKTRINELFDGFLTKPIDSGQLLAAVQRYAVGAAKASAAGVSS